MDVKRGTSVKMPEVQFIGGYWRFLAKEYLLRGEICLNRIEACSCHTKCISLLRVWEGYCLMGASAQEIKGAFLG